MFGEFSVPPLCVGYAYAGTWRMEADVLSTLLIEAGVFSQAQKGVPDMANISRQLLQGSPGSAF